MHYAIAILFLCLAAPLHAQSVRSTEAQGQSQLLLAQADVSVGIHIGIPGANMGIHVPAYPRLVRVPNLPVYYSPSLAFNFFFYDGEYWLFHDDRWYASVWFDGPWVLVEPEFVPLFVLRVPVRYYRAPPPYFRPWSPAAPPRWAERWGREWEQRRDGWDRWDRRDVPRPAPLPTYQRRYSQDRYPSDAERQHVIRSERYPYQPREQITRQHFDRGKPAATPGKGPKDNKDNKDNRR